MAFYNIIDEIHNNNNIIIKSMFLMILQALIFKLKEYSDCECEIRTWELWVSALLLTYIEY
jgi:hypothetical protein